ncbi:MAG: serine hydrolase [Candidatus Adlerbacteria bacterium]
MKLRRTHALVVLGALLAGVVLGWYIHAFAVPAGVYRGAIVRDDNSGYSLIDPILACDIGPEDAFPELNPIKQAIANTIADDIRAKNARAISVYVRLLKSGKWFVINPDSTYAPASLLKVFIMTSYYKENEDYPGVLNKQLVYQGSENPTDDNPGEVIPHLTSGQTYSVRDIIRQMIVYSDNDAFNTLVNNFDAKTLAAFNDIFTDLNIPSPATQSEDKLQFMTVSAYATIFRVLFGATYLTRDDSERALSLLTQAQYKDGIVSGVPASLAVAHKFGVRSIPATATTPAASELHDCGVVYYPNHPYLLCVMTHGKDFAKLQQNLQDISKVTYQQMDAYYASRPAVATTTPPVGK